MVEWSFYSIEPAQWQERNDGNDLMELGSHLHRHSRMDSARFREEPLICLA
jgi:hypothetical protein